MPRVRIKEEDLIPFLKSEYPSDKVWKSFYKMWMDAKGYHYGDEEYIVDGCRDGGIDAIAYPPPQSKLRITVIQSKHFQGKVSKSDLNQFFKAVEALKSKTEINFDQWVTSVPRVSLRPMYRSLRDKVKKNEVDFVIVTSGKMDRESLGICKKLKIKIEDKKSVVALYKDMAQGKSPRPEQITLRTRGKVLPIIKENEHGLYVFASYLQDFAKCFQDERNNLFAGNVREGINDSPTGEVNRGIDQTLKERPEDFAYFHNGITIVCKKIRKVGNKVILTSPSIVNGAQTVTYLGKTLAGKIPKEATVLVKAIQVDFDGGFEEFETDVAMSSNTQNKVKLGDLSVVDPNLVSLDRFFKSNKCFIERKKGSRPLGKVDLSITRDRILQLMCSLELKLTPAIAKDVQNLYKSHHARDLFKKYNSTNEKRKDALFIAKLDKLVGITLKEFKGTGVRGKRKAKRLAFSSFTIFATTAHLIRDKGMWTKIRGSFNEDGHNNSIYTSQLKKDIRKVAASILAQARVDPEKNMNEFFKSKIKVSASMKNTRKKLKNKVGFHKI